MDYSDRIGEAKRWMAERLGERISLDEAAEAAAFSKYHFHRIFAAVSGETPAAFIKRLRLEKSAGMLAYIRSAPVTEIALECGFATPSAFARDFKARFGVTPRAYRERPAAIAGSGSPAARASGQPPEATADFSWTIRRVEPMRLAEAAREGRYDRAAGAAWSALMRRWFSSGRTRAPELAVGIAWDNPGVTDEARCRYSACAVLGEAEVVPAGLRETILPASTCLSVSWRGPRGDYASAYEYLYGVALPESESEPADSPAFELYRSITRGPSVDVDLYLPLAE
ncbi:MAG: AraC family transcriptional regulator [Spirochaetes bacterium]|nr:AraC family transcriptional regulator [Spirochaetota bacterium]MBU1081110.1 AraC family transcriptional regulator [Spirochaetota bacterium]